MPNTQHTIQTAERSVVSSSSANMLPHFLHGVKGATSKISWVHVAFKVCVYLYIGFVAWIAWHVLPLPGHWRAVPQAPEVVKSGMTNYFNTFAGTTECKITGNDLYAGPTRDIPGMFPSASFCTNRHTLLTSMSEGGRIGIDAPYNPRGCHYGWFDTASICMILERFDGIIFIGDHSLQPVYGGFNILLRQDLIYGAMQSWSFSPEEMAGCGCEKQFTREACLAKLVTSSEQVEKTIQQQHEVRLRSHPYVCSRVPHAFLRIDDTATLSQEIRKKFHTLAPKRPASFFRHIPVIFSLSAHSATTTTESAKRALLNVLRLADDTGRKMDVLALGPTAPGHIDIKGRKNNQAIWDFQQALARVARENDVDVLGLWNMTVQAASWDGVRFGQGVAITQAMMVINWLSRLETS